MEFKLGDRVECIRVEGSVKVGLLGTVVHLPDIRQRERIGVRWDKMFPFGHDLHYNSDKPHCDYGYGRYMSEDAIKLVIRKKTNLVGW